MKNVHRTLEYYIDKDNYALKLSKSRAKTPGGQTMAIAAYILVQGGAKIVIQAYIDSLIPNAHLEMVSAHRRDAETKRLINTPAYRSTPPYARHFIYEDSLTDNLLKKYKKIAGTEILLPNHVYKIIRRYIETHYYNKQFFGRKTNLDRPQNRPNSGFETIDYGRYNYNYATHKFAYRYNFTAVLSPSKNKIFLRIAGEPDQIINITKNGTFKFNGKFYFKPKEENFIDLKPHSATRLIKLHIPADFKIRYCHLGCHKKYFEISYKNETFYFLTNNFNDNREFFSEYIPRAINILRDQHADTLKINRIKSLAAQVWVTIDDADKAGHCSRGTVKFKNKLLKILKADGDICAVRGDFLLSISDNSYTRRAVHVALRRNHINF